MLRLASSLNRHQRLLRDFVRRDLLARYVGSSMGFFWSVIFPLVNLAVYMFVFRTVLTVRWEASPELGALEQSPSQTALTMLAGITVWAAFAETISRSTNCLVENSNLIQKVVFPSEIVPAYLSISAAVNMLIGIVIVLLGCVFLDPHKTLTLAFSPERISLALVCLPLLIALQIVFTAGLGYLLATLNLYLRDTYHVIGVATTVWMFATPIFYPDFIVVKKGYGWILQLNPMYWLIESYRDVLIEAHWPDWLRVAQFAGVALLALWVGSAVFLGSKKSFPDML